MKTFKEQLTETSLGRVFQHTENKDTPFGIISAFRGNLEYEENKRRNKSLAAEIRKAGFGHFHLIGHWVETSDTGEEQSVQEDSIFVVGRRGQGRDGNLKGTLKQLMKAYDQEAVVFSPSDTTLAYFLYNDGNMELINKYGQFNPKAAGKAYSELRNDSRAFVFEKEMISGGFFHHLAKDKSKFPGIY